MNPALTCEKKSCNMTNGKTQVEVERQLERENVQFDSRSESAAPSNVQYSERDYDTPSDVELLMGLSEEDAAKGEQRQMLKEFQQKERKIESLQKKLQAVDKMIESEKNKIKE